MIILIKMAQVLFFNAFPEKNPHLNAVEFRVEFSGSCLETDGSGFNSKRINVHIKYGIKSLN